MDRSRYACAMNIEDHYKIILFIFYHLMLEQNIDRISYLIFNYVQ